MKNTYRHIYLSTGEHIIGKYNDDNESDIILDTVAVITAQPQPDGNGFNVSFVPFNPFSQSDKQNISKSSVVYNEESPKELSDGYKQATGQATIVTPPKSGLILPN